jgi:large-conductance mechanosensitive channel
MLSGLWKVLMTTLVAMLIGGAFGLMIGVLVENVLLWVILMAGVGAMMGIAFGYGFLPES